MQNLTLTGSLPYSELRKKKKKSNFNPFAQMNEFYFKSPQKCAAYVQETTPDLTHLFTPQLFSDVAYKARDREDLIAGIDEFLDEVIVLPPGEWDPNIRIEPPKKVPSAEKRCVGDMGLVPTLWPSLSFPFEDAGRRQMLCLHSSLDIFSTDFPEMLLSLQYHPMTVISPISLKSHFHST